jgi:hypothetical protein
MFAAVVEVYPESFAVVRVMIIFRDINTNTVLIVEQSYDSRQNTS